ncbi:MAG: glycine--tRNA ligase subunit beta [Halioglobus sp.]
MVFQQQLGTLLDKTHRVIKVAAGLAERMGAAPAPAERAALLSKTDLLTEMVVEFADMQGVAGQYCWAMAAATSGSSPSCSA